MDTPEDWPFEDSPNVAVITTRQVIDEHRPILLVTHDEEDGGWQFLTGETVSEADAKIVALSTIWTLDRSVGELARLPLGWRASRRTRLEPWQIFEQS